VDLVLPDDVVPPGHRDGKPSMIASVLAADSTRSNVLMDM
jgi:hypothetical protein